jgi:hypothetical protein
MPTQHGNATHGYDIELIKEIVKIGPSGEEALSTAPAK